MPDFDGNDASFFFFCPNHPPFFEISFFYCIKCIISNQKNQKKSKNTGQNFKSTNSFSKKNFQFLGGKYPWLCRGLRLFNLVGNKLRGLYRSFFEAFLPRQSRGSRNEMATTS
jgi:hypothetical protein